MAIEIVAIVPARGGSKGVSRKNLVTIAGKPLLVHSLEQAQQAELVSTLAVSTEDSEIASVAEEQGAIVVPRPQELAGDAVSSERVLLHALDWLAEERSIHSELVVFLQATSPCRLSSDIDQAITKLLESGSDSLFSSCEEHFTGRWRRGTDGSFVPVNFSLENRPRRQEYPIEYLENGSIYVFRSEMFRETGSRLGGQIETYCMPAVRSLQLDTVADIAMIDEIMGSLSVVAP